MSDFWMGWGFGLLTGVFIGGSLLLLVVRRERKKIRPDMSDRAQNG